MFGSLGFPEILFILVLALLVFGPRRLPEVGRTIGKALGEFRRATGDLKRSFDQETSSFEQQVRSAPPAAAPRQEDPEPTSKAAGVQTSEATSDVASAEADSESEIEDGSEEPEQP